MMEEHPVTRAERIEAAAKKVEGILSDLLATAPFLDDSWVLDARDALRRAHDATGGKP